MKFKKHPKEGVCSAMRCTQEAKGTVIVQGKYLDVCERHKAEAAEPSDHHKAEAAEPSDREAALVAAEDAKGVLEELEFFNIETQEDVSFAEEGLRDVKAQWKALEDKRKAATGPLNKSLKEINSWFKPAQTTLKDAENLFKKKLRDARARFAEEQARLLKEAQEAETPEEIQDALISAADATLDVSSKTTFRDNWKFRIVNEYELPRCYLMPNERSIAGMVKEQKGDCKIPGIEVYNEPIVTSRR